MDKVQRKEKEQNAYPFICKSCYFSGLFMGENEKFRCSNCNSASVITNGPLPKDFIQDRPDFLENYNSGLWSRLPDKKNVPKTIRIEISYYKPFYHTNARDAHMAVVEKDKKKGLQKLKRAVKKAYPHIKDIFVEDFTVHLEDPLIQKLQSTCVSADRQIVESYIKKESFIGRDVWCKTCHFTSVVNLFLDERFSCLNCEQSYDVFLGQVFHDPYEFLCSRYLGMYIKGQIPLHRFFKCQNCGIQGCIVDWKKKKTRCFSCMSDDLEFISSHLQDDSNSDHKYQRCPTCGRQDTEFLGYIKTGEENVARKCYKFCKKCNKIFFTISRYEYRCGFGDEFSFYDKSSINERYKGKSCPKCKEAKNLIPIWYGWPSKKEFREAKEGKVFLGGCNPEVRKLFRFCKKCGVCF